MCLFFVVFVLSGRRQRNRSHFCYWYPTRANLKHLGIFLFSLLHLETVFPDIWFSLQPLVRCGLTIYGDYQPSSTSTVDARYFTNDPVSFIRELRGIRFEYGGVFRNAVTEGLVSALEVNHCALPQFFKF